MHSTNDKGSVSRRGFVAGAALSAAALGASRAMASESAKADGAAKATSADGETAGTSAAGKDVHWSWDVKPDPITDDQCTKTYDCDVAIVGLGAGGTPAALYAATHGLNTVVLQKGDHSISNGWCANAINNKAYLGTGGEPFDTGQLFSDFVQYTNGRENGTLVRMFIERGGEVMDWILDQTTEIEPKVVEKGQTIGWYEGNDFQTRYTGFANLLKLMAQKAEDAGATMLWDTPAVQLVTNKAGDTVTGVIGQDADGNYVKVNASKGVLLACGDVTDDEEMLQCFAPIMLGVKSLHGFPNNTGDGVRMGSWIGAKITPAPHAYMMHFDPTWLPEGDAPFSGIPWLRVNINGKRFGNEDVSYQSVVVQVAQQPEKVAFQICDSNWLQDLEDADYFPNANSHSRENPDPEGNWQKFIESGAIIQSDTLEGLADAYGIDKENFLATVQRYNDLCDKGVDEDFGVRSDFIVHTAIKEPPFYAIKRVPSVLASVGGVQINDDLRVLRDDDTPFNGLYACGDVAGSFYGNEYPLALPGGSIGRGFTFGILSVKAMCGDLDSKVE